MYTSLWESERELIAHTIGLITHFYTSGSLLFPTMVSNTTFSARYSARAQFPLSTSEWEREREREIKRESIRIIIRFICRSILFPDCFIFHFYLPLSVLYAHFMCVCVCVCGTCCTQALRLALRAKASEWALSCVLQLMKLYGPSDCEPEPPHVYCVRA